MLLDKSPIPFCGLVNSRLIILRQVLLKDAQPAVRKAAFAAGLLVLLGASEAYSGSVTRTLRSLRRSGPFCSITRRSSSCTSTCVMLLHTICLLKSIAFHASRSFQAAVAAWLEEQSGLSLLTPEGECSKRLCMHMFEMCALMMQWTQCCEMPDEFRLSGTV